MLCQEENMMTTGRSNNPEESDIGMDSGVARPQGKQPFAEPKLTFIEPKLVKHGGVTQVTGFFGTFSP